MAAQHNLTFCTGQKIKSQINVTGVGTIHDYQWYKGSEAISGATTDSLVITAAALTDDGAYYCTYKDGNNCSYFSDTINIDVQQTPTITAVSGGSICNLTGEDITNSIAGSYASSNTTVATIAVVDVSTAHISALTPGSTTITFTSSESAGCKATLDYTIKPTPIMTALQSATTTCLCSGEGCTYTPTGTTIPEGTSYTWTFTDNANITGESNGTATGVTTFNQSNLRNSSTTADETITYTVTPLAGNGCAGGDFNITVCVHPTTTATITVNGNEIH